MTGHMGCTPLGRRWRRRVRGFRLSSGKFSVLRLRLKLARFLGLFGRCLLLLRRGVGGSGGHRRWAAVNGRRGGGGRQPECGVSFSGRSNSFYADAIAECLEFIKRTSVSVDTASPVN
ncbi:unnamed protein product [Spirodela intermedia]|uniref:Uncharacterized protein n=2 Tax=Spirodela intermedia TaxID=51605 RepID=A0A7I8JJ64_SPIIN|nr:unnamed protein product [Spirodela intermedia]CAA6670207.1 unnamed protein product [Spirodela intermedia]CAA7407260.1 unnamed protein product [Spirodela intermedia]